MISRVSRLARPGGIVGYAVLHEAPQHGLNRRWNEQFSGQERKLRTAFQAGLREILDDRISGNCRLSRMRGLIRAVCLVLQKRRAALAIADQGLLPFDRPTVAALLIRLHLCSTVVWEAGSGRNLTADVSPWIAVLARSSTAAVKTALREVEFFQKQVSHRLRESAPGLKPFGSLPGEKETLARIRLLRLKPRNGKRHSFGRIAIVLNREGRLTRMGKPWLPRTVRKLVADNWPRLI